MLISHLIGLETVVEINPLPRDTGPLWHLSFHSLPSLGLPLYQFIDNLFGRMNSWVSCVLTALVWDWTWGLVVRRANHCVTEALNFHYSLSQFTNLEIAYTLLSLSYWFCSTGIDKSQNGCCRLQQNRASRVLWKCSRLQRDSTKIQSS